MGCYGSAVEGGKGAGRTRQPKHVIVETASVCHRMCPPPFSPPLLPSPACLPQRVRHTPASPGRQAAVKWRWLPAGRAWPERGLEGSHHDEQASRAVWEISPPVCPSLAVQRASPVFRFEPCRPLLGHRGWVRDGAGPGVGRARGSGSFSWSPHSLVTGSGWPNLGILGPG